MTNFKEKIIFVRSIDLSPLENRLCNTQYNTDLDPLLSKKFFDYCTNKYKKFLELCVIYPEKKLAPDKFIDIIWHYHILDTKRYIEDCNILFGSYMHHMPNYSSSFSEVDFIEDDIEALFKKHFNEDFYLTKEKYYLMSQ